MEQSLILRINLQGNIKLLLQTDHSHMRWCRMEYVYSLFIVNTTNTALCHGLGLRNAPNWNQTCHSGATGQGRWQVTHVGATHGTQAQQLPQYQRHVQQTGRTTVPFGLYLIHGPYKLLIHPCALPPTVIHADLRLMLTCCRVVKCGIMSCALSNREIWAVHATNSVIKY